MTRLNCHLSHSHGVISHFKAFTYSEIKLIKFFYHPVIDPHVYISVGDCMTGSEVLKPSIRAEHMMYFDTFSFMSEDGKP